MCVCKCVLLQMLYKSATTAKRVKQYIVVVCVAVKSFADNFSFDAAHYVLSRTHYKFKREYLFSSQPISLICSSAMRNRQSAEAIKHKQQATRERKERKLLRQRKSNHDAHNSV